MPLTSMNAGPDCSRHTPGRRLAAAGLALALAACVTPSNTRPEPGTGTSSSGEAQAAGASLCPPSGLPPHASLGVIRGALLRATLPVNTGVVGPAATTTTPLPVVVKDGQAVETQPLSGADQPNGQAPWTSALTGARLIGVVKAGNVRTDLLFNHLKLADGSDVPLCAVLLHLDGHQGVPNVWFQDQARLPAGSAYVPAAFNVRVETAF